MIWLIILTLAVIFNYLITFKVITFGGKEQFNNTYMQQEYYRQNQENQKNQENQQNQYIQ
jgi:hypothetical protein